MSKHSPNSSPDRQLPLSEKVGQIIQNVADMTFAKNLSEADTAFSVELSGEAVSGVIQAWSERARYLPGELFSDPAWVMLLELLHAELDQRRLTVSKLCKASRVPTSTANRWLMALEDHALVIRQADRHDATSPFVELTPNAGTALRRYFRDVVQRR